MNKGLKFNIKRLLEEATKKQKEEMIIDKFKEKNERGKSCQI